MSHLLDPIATVRSCFGEKFCIPRQPGLCSSAWGELMFHPAYRSVEAIRGLEGFSHVWLIFRFHQTEAQGWHPTVRPPRLGGNQRVGVFASRSTFRPNGLGLSLVKFEGIDTERLDGPVLHLSGLDLVDGTPIYDIKPYLPYAEALPNALSGYAPAPEMRLDVEIAASAQQVFDSLSERAQSVIREVLMLDPRPSTQTQDESRIFGARLCGYDIHFSISENHCRVLELVAANNAGLAT